MIIIRLKKESINANLSYSIVVSIYKKSPISGDFLDKVGLYKPLIDKWSNRYIYLDMDKVSYWLKRGAKIDNSVFILIATLIDYRNSQSKISNSDNLFINSKNT